MCSCVHPCICISVGVCVCVYVCVCVCVHLDVFVCACVCWRGMYICVRAYLYLFMCECRLEDAENRQMSAVPQPPPDFKEGTAVPHVCTPSSALSSFSILFLLFCHLTSVICP